jgi:MFS superfamily sulfate permease-like transporter
MSVADLETGPAAAASRSDLSFAKIWKGDLVSGFQVFLIALPLSLGIAMASGFPPMAGIVAAVVGGLVVSRLSGSHVTINGPAAGLIVVILDGVQRLGHGDNVLGYKLTLAAIVIAGIGQMLCGFLRVGKLASFFPVSVVHGMLSAIGITIIAKQVPVMLGAKPQASSIFGLLATIPATVLKANPIVGGIGVLGLAVLIAYRWLPAALRKLLPAQIVVVIIAAGLARVAGVGTGASYTSFGQTFELGAGYLVQIPAQVFGELALPDFSHLYSWDFALVTFSIFAVAGIESLLSASAVDKLDPLQRKTDLNKDLFAVGVGTTVSGLLGGLPMIAEIVRSSANASQGAKTGWANFFHGAFLLVAVLLAPDLIRAIPLSVLAALLVFTGFRLASPQEFKKMKAIGADQLAMFLITCVGVLATNLLVGVVIGVVAKCLLHLYRRVSPVHFVRCRYAVEQKNGRLRVSVSDPLVFSNLVSLAGRLDQVGRDVHAEIDLTRVPFVDHTAMEFLHRMEREFKVAGGSFKIVESAHHVRGADHPLATRRLLPTGTR